MLKNRVSATTHSSARLPYAKVFAAHIWQALFAREPLSRAAGEKLHCCMLARGGGACAGGHAACWAARSRAPRRFCARWRRRSWVRWTMDEATLARVAEALRVRLDGSPGTPE